jgi:hypothetical protein
LVQVELHLLDHREMQVQILFLTHTLLQVAVVVRERLHYPLRAVRVVVAVASQEPPDQVPPEILRAHHLLREILVETEMIMVPVLLLLVEEAVVPEAQETTHQGPQPPETVGWAQPTQSQEPVSLVLRAAAEALINLAALEQLEQADQALAAMEVATD